MLHVNAKKAPNALCTLVLWKQSCFW